MSVSILKREGGREGEREREREMEARGREMDSDDSDVASCIPFSLLSPFFVPCASACRPSLPRFHTLPPMGTHAIPPSPTARCPTLIRRSLPHSCPCLAWPLQPELRVQPRMAGARVRPGPGAAHLRSLAEAAAWRRRQAGRRIHPHRSQDQRRCPDILLSRPFCRPRSVGARSVHLGPPSLAAPWS